MKNTLERLRWVFAALWRFRIERILIRCDKQLHVLGCRIVVAEEVARSAQPDLRSLALQKTRDVDTLWTRLNRPAACTPAVLWKIEEQAKHERLKLKICITLVDVFTEKRRLAS